MKTLYIIWQDHASRRWIPVGKLTKGDGTYRFVYTHGAMMSPKFIPLGTMHDLHSAYESSDLFPLFTNRLLAKNRPEYNDYLSWLNLERESSDPFLELARTGGIRATDSLVVIPCPTPSSEGTFGLSFFCNGIRYLPPEAQNWVRQLEPGRPLFLMQDSQNDQDSMAIAIRTEPVMVVGYVPRYYAEDFRHLLNEKLSGSVKVWVEKVNPDAPIQLRLLCGIKSPWPDDFQPCSGESYTPLA